MLNPDSATAGLTFLSVATTATFWNANNPEVYKVRDMADDPSGREDLKLALVKSMLEASLFGIGASLLVKSPWPFVAGMSYIGINYLFFNWAVDHPRGIPTVVGNDY